ncbi:MAG: hypothetical protein MRY72_10220 [Aquisalinus sp.]|nr:hypothetical protein [Aquisalinus sp.]
MPNLSTLTPEQIYEVLIPLRGEMYAMWFCDLVRKSDAQNARMEANHA